MKRILAIIPILLIASAVMAVPTPVSTYEPSAKCNRDGHLYLVEKDSIWTIVADGAWGKLNYKGKKFVFNGHGLDADTAYTLIYYGDETHNDEWPYATCMASGTTNSDSNIHLSGEMISLDNDAEKIWLVLSDDVDCENGRMTGWNPTSYLFEYDVI